MANAAQDIWMLCVFALFYKTALPDVYIAYFKWVQARDARKMKGMNYSTAESIVKILENSNTYVLFAAAACMLAAGCLLLPIPLRSPVLTFAGLISAGLSSSLGALGDHARAEAMAAEV